MIYFIRDPLTKRVKIGVSDAPWARLSQIQTGCPTVLMLAALMEGGRADELALHARFSEYHIRGEWFAETAALAEYVAALAIPIRPSLRRQRPAMTPFDGWMNENGLRNRELGARFGLSQPFISRMRNGQRQPTLDIACALADLTGLDPRDFIVSTREQRRSAKAA